MSAGKPKVGFIAGLSTFVNGVPDAGGALRYIKVLEPLSDEIIWITASGLRLEDKISKNIIPVEIGWSDVHEKPFLSQALYHLFQQIKITLKLLKLRKVDVFLFARGLDFYILPILFARVFLRKKIVIKSDGRSSFAVRRYLGRGKKHKIALIKVIERIAYFLVNKIVVDSTYAISLNNMQKYRDKICIAASDGHVDTRIFTKSKELPQRTYDIGYVGRFSRKKGFLEFMQSLFLLPSNEHLKVAIIGGQPQDDEIQKLLVDINAQNRAEVVGWVGAEELVQYLNDIRLVVIPSYGEGLPKTALEAMACGCIVVSTPVGSLPAIIQDENTGFILKNNSPSQIAEGIARALSYPRLDSIAQNARLLIDKEYTYQVMVKKWRHILNSL